MRWGTYTLINHYLQAHKHLLKQGKLSAHVGAILQPYIMNVYIYMYEDFAGLFAHWAVNGAVEDKSTCELDFNKRGTSGKKQFLIYQSIHVHW